MFNAAQVALPKPDVPSTLPQHNHLQVKYGFHFPNIHKIPPSLVISPHSGPPVRYPERFKRMAMSPPDHLHLPTKDSEELGCDLRTLLFRSPDFPNKKFKDWHRNSVSIVEVTSDMESSDVTHCDGGMQGTMRGMPVYRGTM